MPLRYSQETQLVTAVDLIVRVLDECERAFTAVPIAQWPLFGGWENFLPGDSAPVSPDLVVEPEPEEEEDGDFSDVEDGAPSSASGAPGDDPRSVRVRDYVEIWWPGNRRFFPARVVGRDRAGISNCVDVVYLSDGAACTHDLDEHRWRRCDRPA